MRNFLVFTVLTVACLTSCGKIIEDAVPGVDCLTEDYSELTTTYTEYYEAVLAFEEDRTEEKCQLAKEKGRAYLNSLEEWADCYDAFYPDEDYEEELAEARLSIEEESCD